MSYFKNVLTCVLASCVLTVWGQGKREEVYKSLYKELNANGYGYKYLEELTGRIGHRLTGSPKGKLGEQFAYGKFYDMGFQKINFQMFMMNSWMRDSVKLTLTGKQEIRTLPVVSLAHTPLYVDTSGVIIWAGSGLAKDFARLGEVVKGKMVLLHLGLEAADTALSNLHRSEKVALALKAGAVGVICMNNAKGGKLLTGTASVDGNIIPIPAVSITHEEGRALQAQLEGGAKIKARIWMKNKMENVRARNTIATLPGRDSTAGKIVIGGHLDSWDLATGACDNGLGTMTIADIARAFQKLDLKPLRTIEFVMFMGEEQGLFGSTHYVKEALKDGSIDKIKYMINLDMTTNAKGYNISGRNEMQSFVDELVKVCKSLDTSFAGTVSTGVGLHSDHQPFMMEGVPTMGIVGQLDKAALDCYHSDCDRFDLIKDDQMRRCAVWTSIILYALADSENLPTKRLSSEETRDFFIKAGLKEAMIIQGDWKW